MIFINKCILFILETFSLFDNITYLPISLKVVKSFPMDLQKILNSRQAGVLALRVSRAVPPRLGFFLADKIAKMIAKRQDLPLVQAIRSNQWVVRGEPNDSKQLDQAVVETLSFLGRSFYEIFHNINDLKGLESLMDESPIMEHIIQRSQEGKRGLLVLGVHMGNFDLMMQVAAQRGLNALALSLPKNTEAIEWQHQYRRSAGLEILPTSQSSLRIAIERLKNGGTVLTGIDHPLAEAKYKPHLFGYPANIPVHYIQIALKADVPVILLASVKDLAGKYQTFSSDEITFIHYKDRHEQIILNAETILAYAERFIQPTPEQWVVVQPVWPDAVKRMP